MNNFEALADLAEIKLAWETFLEGEWVPHGQVWIEQRPRFGDKMTSKFEKLYRKITRNFINLVQNCPQEMRDTESPIKK